HALDDEHVVGPALDARHPDRRATADAGRGVEAGHVAGAIPDDGERLLGQGGEDELALHPGRHGLARGVDDLGEEMVLVDVAAATSERAITSRQTWRSAVV